MIEGEPNVIINSREESLKKAKIDLSKFEQIGLAIGTLVTEKNKAYGDSFNKSEQIIKILYPNGIQPNQYNDFLSIIRILDKLFRIATDKDAYGESPWNDVCGYSILSCEHNSK